MPPQNTTKPISTLDQVLKLINIRDLCHCMANIQIVPPHSFSNIIDLLVFALLSSFFLGGVLVYTSCVLGIPPNFDAIDISNYLFKKKKKKKKKK